MSIGTSRHEFYKIIPSCNYLKRKTLAPAEEIFEQVHNRWMF